MNPSQGNTRFHPILPSYASSMRISMYSFAAVFTLGLVSERCLQARHAVHDLRVQRSARGFGLDLGIARVFSLHSSDLCVACEGYES